MNRTLAAALSMALIPMSVFAQSEFEGLDLTQDADAQKTEAPPADTAAEVPPPSAAPATSSSTPPSATTSDSPTLVNTDLERNITREDRVKSVQRKLYLKRNRFELAPYVTVSVNDPYYTKFGGAIRGAYYLADSLALSARFTLLQVVPTDDVRVAKRTFNSRIFFSVPKWSAMADVEWSPIYGKVSFYNSILHFDAYVLGGAGVVVTETSAAKAFPELGAANTETRGPNPAADLGLGMRLVAKDFLAVNVALINTAYTDQPTGTTNSKLQNMLTLNAGVSIFFPFKSTFREAE